MAMTYKDHLTAAMTELGKDPLFRVCGYNCTKPGGEGGGTFSGVPEQQRHELPLAECLNAGVAIGMSLGGFRPLLWIERFDFMFHAMDAIVNHLDKMALLSDGTHKPAVIIRTAIGKRTTPLFTEPTHTQDLTRAMCEMVNFRVVKLMWKEEIQAQYARAMRDLIEHKSTLLVEDSDLLAT